MSALRLKALLGALALSLISAAAPAAAQVSQYTTGTRYDSEGRVTGSIGVDPDGAGAIGRLAERRSYDGNGWLIRVESGVLSSWQDENIAPANWTGFTISQTVETAYDIGGRKLRDTLIAGGVVQSVTQYSYDGLDRVICTAQRMNPASYGALPADACTPGPAGSFGGDRITRQSYDIAGRVLLVQKAVGTPLQQDYVRYTYTPNGQQASVTDANGATATFSYDGFDRKTRWNFPSKVTAGLASSDDYEAYDYDAAGNRISHRKRDGSVITFTYDALNRLTRKTVPERAGLDPIHTRDVFYGYDLRGLQLYARFDSDTGEGVANSYDNLGRLLTSVSTMGGAVRTLSYAHDAGSNRTRITYPGGLSFAYAYNGANQPTSIIDEGNAIGIIGYSYDALSRPFVKTNHFGDHSVYYYDARSRLYFQSEVFVGGVGDIQRTHSYNPVSQMVSRTLSNDAYAFTGEVDAARSYAVNGLNQYVSAGGLSLTYDANGNLTSDGRSNYLYDVENRLVSRSGEAIAALRYDPLGRLFEVTGASEARRFLYDGDELVAEYDLSGNVTARYVHGRGTDDPLVWYEGPGIGDRRYLHSDERGSITGIAGTDGRLRSINSYDTWGIPALTNQGRFGFTGQIWLPALGMWYYKARIYSPTLGRFMQTDPIGYEDQINLYAYVGNDPVNSVDPDGMKCVKRDADGECEEWRARAKRDKTPPRQLPASTTISTDNSKNRKKDNKICTTPPSPGAGKAEIDRNIVESRQQAKENNDNPAAINSLANLRDVSIKVTDSRSQNYKANPKYPGSSEYGNFNFGATMQGRGFSLKTTLFLSDAFQRLTTLRADPVEDIRDVTNGYNYAQNGCEHH